MTGRTGSPQRNGDTEQLRRGSTGRPASQADERDRIDRENEHHRIHQVLVFTIDPIARVASRRPSNPCRSVQPPLLRCSVVKPFPPSSPFPLSPSSLFRCAVAAAAAVAVLSCRPTCGDDASTGLGQGGGRSTGVASLGQRRAAWRSQPAPRRRRHDERRRPALRGGARSVRARIPRVLHGRGPGRTAGIRGSPTSSLTLKRPSASDERIAMQIDDAGESWVGRWPAGRRSGVYDRTSWLFDSSRAVLDRFTIQFPTVRPSPPSAVAVFRSARRVCDRCGRQGPAAPVPAPDAQSGCRRGHARVAPEGAARGRESFAGVP